MQLDGFNHWPSILGERTTPRTEIVLNLPRSKSWTLGESETDEGVALISGKYKLLLNHAYDSWFSPSAGPDHLDYTMMNGITCRYSFYTIAVCVCVLHVRLSLKKKKTKEVKQHTHTVMA